MEFRLLGAFEVWDNGEPLEIAGAKRRALLALLVLRANEVVRSELLVDELWGEHPPRNAAAALHNHVSRLRKTLGGETIASREWGYVLRAAPEEIDLRRFERLIAEAEPLAAQQRATKLAEGLALWRGPPLADLVNEPALHHDVARLEELRLSTLERRIDADLEAGQSGTLVGELEGLIADQPLREHLRWLLILALYRAGRQAEALEVYRETRRVLTEELGLEPSPALKELEQAILRQDPSLDASAAPTHTEPLVVALQPNRRRVPPVALLALLALGLAGTATAIALVRPEKGASSETATEAIFQTLTETTAGLVSTSPTTETHKTATPKHQTTAPPGHTTSNSPSTTAKHAPVTRPPTTIAPRAHKRHKVTPPPKPVTISDNFAEGYVDPTIWHQVKDGGDVSIAEQGGQLQLTVGPQAVPGGTYNQIDVHVGTQCSFPGNFDARVDYTLLEWPAGDNIDVGLNAIYADGGVMRENSSQWGDEYSSWVGTSNGSPPIPDTSGSLRIKRVKGIETTYFLHNGTWRELASSPESGSAVFGLQAFSDGHNPFGGQEVKVGFDNFQVTGINPICAPGDQPPGSSLGLTLGPIRDSLAEVDRSHRDGLDPVRRRRRHCPVAVAWVQVTSTAWPGGACADRDSDRLRLV
jgi:DNA-binding SARP family transcriptional activator